MQAMISYYFSSSEICSLLKGNYVDLKSEPAVKLSRLRDRKTIIYHAQHWFIHYYSTGIMWSLRAMISKPVISFPYGT